MALSQGAGDLPIGGREQFPISIAVQPPRITAGQTCLVAAKDIGGIDPAEDHRAALAINANLRVDFVIGPSCVARERPRIGERSPGNGALRNDLLEAFAGPAGAGKHLECAILIRKIPWAAMERR